MNVEHWIHRLSRLAGEDTSKRFDRLYREIAKPEFLWFAYDQIKGNRGSRTPGVDGQTASDWTIREVEALSALLRDGSYQPQPVWRVYIPKKSGKLRPLGIPAFEDRVVQSAVKIVLEALYEPIFLDCSHGFRPGKGCHTALHAVQDCPKVRMDWVVEGDIKGFFDHVSHPILLKLLHKRIRDDRLLNLIAKFLKAGYFDRDLWNPTKEGTPQGGIISPTLANIYLHAPDQFVVEQIGANQECRETPQEVRARINPEYRSVDSRINKRRARLRRRGDQLSDEERAAVEADLAALLKKRRVLPRMIQPIRPRTVYVRYADDFVIVLRNMPQSVAQRIKQRLTEWLRDSLRLELSPEKTLVTHISDGFVFLGYKFAARKRDPLRMPSVKMMIPYDAAAANVETVRDICSKQGLSEAEVIRKINSTLRGWMMYYSCVSTTAKVFNYVPHKTFWAYASYVSRKHRLTIKQAAQRWVRRCPADTRHMVEGKKTWCATEPTSDGVLQTEWLICKAIPKQHLPSVAGRIGSKPHPYLCTGGKS
jgi:group II intron reverse transcriptase/maturase